MTKIQDFHFTYRFFFDFLNEKNFDVSSLELKVTEHGFSFDFKFYTTFYEETITFRCTHTLASNQNIYRVVRQGHKSGESVSEEDWIARFNKLENEGISQNPPDYLNEDLEDDQ
jgi:hypothetical protein